MSEVLSFLGTGGAPDRRQVSATNPLPVILPGDRGSIDNPSYTQQGGYKAAATVTRPANTTGYSAGDVIGVDAGVLQVETATAAGTVTAAVSQVETATASGTITPGVQQVETATASGTVTAAVAQVETATAVGTITGTGNATVVVTGAGIAGSPVTVPVPVWNGDTTDEWAFKVRQQLALNTAITALYTVGGASSTITLTRISPVANDGTLNISLDNGTCTGITAAPTSANTTAGVATGAGNATVVVTGAGITGSPVTLSVAVADGDTASTWAAKVRTALAANAAIAALYTAGGSTTAITLTSILKSANDSTLNISLANGTSTGINAAPTSANTTAGVATGAGNATVVVTGAGIAGSPITIPVAVADSDTASTWAGKVRTALAANSAIVALYTVGGSTTAITLTRTVPVANDTSLNISLDNGTCTGINAAPTSANTTAGVATGAGNATVVLTGASITGSPVTVPVAVSDGDTASTWAGRVRTALAANAAIAAIYTVGGSTTAITLTRIVAAADDPTLNISLANGTSTGITAAPTSTHTTAGSLTSANAGSAILTLSSIGPSGGHIFITDVNLELDRSSIPTGMTTFRLHLYDASPDAILDNAAWAFSSAGDRGKYLGYVDLVAPSVLDATLYTQNTIVNKKVKLASASSTLYAELQTTGSYTPASGTVHVLTVHSIAA